MADLVFDDALQRFELGVTLGADVAGVTRQPGELLLVGLQIGEPVVHAHVLQPVLAAANLKGFAQLVVVLVVDNKKCGLQVFGVAVTQFLVTLQALLDVFDLFDGAVHRDGEGAHGAFKALEKVDLHHADQILLALLLAEVMNAFVIGVEVPKLVAYIGEGFEQ